jgi:lysophospholipase L1-like esterase
MIRRLALSAVTVAALTTIGFMAGRLMAERPAPPHLTCRPSLPERATLGQRTALLFGNSQLHDGDWRFLGALAINCARQGMTLRAGLAVADQLPDVTPTVVIVGFGAVEALRAAGQGGQVDVDAFARDMAALLGDLHARWPGAELIALGVPPMRPALLPAPRRCAARLDPLNGVMTRIAQAAGAIFVDPAEALPTDEGGLLAAMTYDGVHLTEAAYGLWQAQIIVASARLGGVTAR